MDRCVTKSDFHEYHRVNGPFGVTNAAFTSGRSNTLQRLLIVMSRNKRLYSLFEKQSDGSWKRITDLALHKDRAVRFWQSALLDHYLAGGPVRELRPVKSSKPINGWITE